MALSETQITDFLFLAGGNLSRPGFSYKRVEHQELGWVIYVFLVSPIGYHLRYSGKRAVGKSGFYLNPWFLRSIITFDKSDFAGLDTGQQIGRMREWIGQNKLAIGKLSPIMEKNDERRH